MIKLIISIFILPLFFVTTTFAQQPFPISQHYSQKQQSFRVIQSSFNVTDSNLLKILKNNQSSSFISKGKTISFNTFIEEKNRIFKLLFPVQLQLKMKDIVFNVDTTMQKCACAIVTVIKSEI